MDGIQLLLVDMELICKGLQATNGYFIKDSSADYPLHQMIDCWVCENFQKAVQ